MSAVVDDSCNNRVYLSGYFNSNVSRCPPVLVGVLDNIGADFIQGQSEPVDLAHVVPEFLAILFCKIAHLGEGLLFCGQGDGNGFSYSQKLGSPY